MTKTQFDKGILRLKEIMGMHPEQRLKPGTLVWIKRLPPHQKHFEQQCYGIVAYSYAQHHGGDKYNKYFLYVFGEFYQGVIGWYDGKYLIAQYGDNSMILNKE